MRQRPIVMVVLIVALVIVGYTAASSGVNPQEFDQAEFSELEEFAEEDFDREDFSDDYDRDEPTERGWFATLVVFLALTPIVLAFLAFVGLLIWGAVRFFMGVSFASKKRKQVTATPADKREEEQMATAVDASLANIDSGSTPREAIIACWITLEHAASERGVHRRESDTPLRLVERLLNKRRINQDDISALMDLYVAARYSQTELTENHRHEARTTLQSIRHQISEEVVDR